MNGEGTWGYFFEYALQWLYEHLGDLLPLDYLQQFIIELMENEFWQQGVKWLNWLFPMGSFETLLSIIFSMLAAYYSASVLLRHFRVVQ